MKFKKRLTLLMIVLLMITTIVSGCAKTPATKDEVESPAVSEEKIVLKLGHVLNEESPFNKGAEEFARLINEKTEGKVEIKIYPNALLGNDRELTEGMQLGTVDMAVCGTATLAGFVPRLQIFDMPFLFRDADHAYKVLDGEIGQLILSDFDEIGIVGLSLWENGFRHVTNSKNPVNTPADLEGFKIRVQEIPLHIDFWKELGTDPTPMAWTEVYTALQQGTVDGQENPIQTIYTQKIYEVQKYISLTGHVYSPAAIMISKASMEELPEAYQKAIKEASIEAADYERNYIEELESKALSELPDLGMIVEENPDKEAFRDVVQPVYEKYGEKLDAKDIIQKILDTK